MTGYADASGDAKMNEQLSEDRAKAVVAYLIQQGGVPVAHVAAPGAMGEYGPVHRMKLRLGEPRIVGLRSKFWSTEAWPPIKMSRRDGELPPFFCESGRRETNTRNLVGAADKSCSEQNTVAVRSCS